MQSFLGSAPDSDRGAYSASPYPLAGRERVTPPPAPTPSLFIHLPDQCFVPSDAHVQACKIDRGLPYWGKGEGGHSFESLARP